MYFVVVIIDTYNFTTYLVIRKRDMSDYIKLVREFMKNESAIASRGGLPNMHSSLIRDLFDHIGDEADFVDACDKIDTFGVVDGAGEYYTNPSQVAWFFGDSKAYLLSEIELISQRSSTRPKRSAIDCIFNGLKGEYSREQIQKAVDGRFEYDEPITDTQHKVARWVVYQVLAELSANFKVFENCNLKAA